LSRKSAETKDVKLASYNVKVRLALLVQWLEEAERDVVCLQ
jgi:exonuclease III